MTQKEAHNCIVLNATQEQKVQMALYCKIKGLELETMENVMAKTVTAIRNLVDETNIEYLNKLIL